MQNSAKFSFSKICLKTTVRFHLSHSLQYVEWWIGLGYIMKCKLSPSTYQRLEVEYQNNNIKYQNNNMKYRNNNMKYQNNNMKYQNNNMKYQNNDMKYPLIKGWRRTGTRLQTWTTTDETAHLASLLYIQGETTIKTSPYYCTFKVKLTIIIIAFETI